MDKINYSTWIGVWIVALLVELLWLYGLLHQVHDQEEFIFRVVVVFATLIVGAVTVICSAIAARRNAG